TVVPAELPDSTAQTLLAAAAGNRDSAERVSEEMQAAVSVRVNGVACRPGRIAIQGSGSGDGKALLRYFLQCAIAPGLFDLEEDWRGSFGPHYRTIVSMRSAQVSGEYALGEETRRLSVDFGMPAPSGLLGFVRFGIEQQSPFCSGSCTGLGLPTRSSRWRSRAGAWREPCSALMSVWSWARRRRLSS